jgi:pilus assembly protein CpaB
VRTRLLTITLAVVLALLGAVAVLAYVRQANQRAIDGLKAETVLMASKPIPAGTSLFKAQKEGLLGTEKVPVSSLSTATPAVQSVNAANEYKVVSAAVAQGQVLLVNMLTARASVTAGSFAVPQGMVAVTVNLCVSEAVADYLTPGSNVAVFDTVTGRDSQVQRTCDAQHDLLNSNLILHSSVAATVLILKKAQVLAVGQNAATGTTAGTNETADPSSSSSSSSTEGEELVTLAVDQADAQRLILIDEVGMPYLALLGPGNPITSTGPVQLFQPQQQQQQP